MNPSTADENVLDNTLKKCMYYTQEWKYGGMIIANIFALRSTNPSSLKGHPDPIGEGNNSAILDVVWKTDVLIAGWGSFGHLGKFVDKRILDVLTLLSAISPGAVVGCLGTNKDGNPKHPLYLRKDSTLQRYSLHGKRVIK